ncbi:hypothetical protein [Bdellovibrio sp. HCB288]|uniref:hypothetical protein n=1 Tax=Bdellovibrio sp. HCB288 TaxID=3394355 RepID=UPI0039B45A66
MKKLGIVLTGLVLAAVFIGACAHDDNGKAKDLASDQFEVSAQGGDDKLIRQSNPSDQAVITGTLKVKGVSQKYMSNLTIHLIDRDATIWARARAASDGSFKLSGTIPRGFYMIRVVDRRFRGELPVNVNGLELENLTVSVQPVIRR